MKKINKKVALTMVLGISLAFAAGCGKKETKDTSDEDLLLLTPTTEAESTMSDAEAEVKAAMDTVYATVQENVSVVNPDYDPTIMYTDYEYYNDGEVHKVS